MTVSPGKREKSGALGGFAGHQKSCVHLAEAACGEHLSLRVCSAPLHLVTPLLEWTGKQLCEYLQTLDQIVINGVVSRAGPDPAPTWLDTAREYTERWLHQQQIRDAVHKPGLKERAFFHPVLDTFVRALPHTYRDVPVADTKVIELVVTGEAGDAWFLVGAASRWSLYKAIEVQPSVVVTMDQEMCWRLFTRGVSKEQVRGIRRWGRECWRRLLLLREAGQNAALRVANGVVSFGTPAEEM